MKSLKLRLDGFLNMSEPPPRQSILLASAPSTPPKSTTTAGHHPHALLENELLRNAKSMVEISKLQMDSGEADFQIQLSPPSPPTSTSNWSPASTPTRILDSPEQSFNCTNGSGIGGSGGNRTWKNTAVSGIYPPQLLPQKSGYLIKQGGQWKTWKKRYFVLQDKNLFYFNAEEDARRENALPLGVIPLSSFFQLSKCSSIMAKDEYCNLLLSGIMKRRPQLFMFTVETIQRSCVLCAESEAEQLDWIRVLQEVDRLNRSSNPDVPITPGSETDSSMAFMNSKTRRLKKEEDCILASGWLEKHSKGVVKRRWCVLLPDSLIIYKAPGDHVAKTLLCLNRDDVTLEVVSPMDEDSDDDESDDNLNQSNASGLGDLLLSVSIGTSNGGAGARKDYHRFALQFKDGSTHWFRCDSGADLEIWVHSLQSVIPLTPSCATLFETLIESIIDGVAHETGGVLSVDDAQSIAWLDSVRISNPVLCHEKDARLQGLPLTTLPTIRLIEESVNISKAISLFSSTLVEHSTGFNDGIEYHLTLVQALIQSCIENPPLQNEFLLQLTKQTTRHPYPNDTKTIQLWQLFALALSICQPTQEAYHYIRLHLLRTIQKHETDIISDYACHCLRMLIRLPDGDPFPKFSPHYPSLRQGQQPRSRLCPPSYLESLNILNSVSAAPPPMQIIVDCKNDDVLSVPFEPFTTVSELSRTLRSALDLVDPMSPLPLDEFKLFLRMPDSGGKFSDVCLELLKDDLFVGDVVFRVDQMMRKNTSSSPSSKERSSPIISSLCNNNNINGVDGGNTGRGGRKSPSSTKMKTNKKNFWWWCDEGNNSFLVFKLRYFLPDLKHPKENITNLILNNCNENEKRMVVNYIVEKVSFKKFDYEDLLNITAYYAQIQWGDHYPLIQNRGLVHSQIKYLLELFHKDYIPKIKLDQQPGQVFQVITQTDSLLGEISNKWMCLRGKSAEQSMNGFLKLTVSNISKYTFKVFVEFCGQDMGDLCKLEVSTSGMRIALYGKTIIKCGYDKVVYYVHGDEKSLVIGVHTSAIDEKYLSKRFAQSDSTKIMIMLCGDNLCSKDFLVIFRHFCTIARK